MCCFSESHTQNQLSIGGYSLTEILGAQYLEAKGSIAQFMWSMWLKLSMALISWFNLKSAKLFISMRLLNVRVDSYKRLSYYCLAFISDSWIKLVD